MRSQAQTDLASEAGQRGCRRTLASGLLCGAGSSGVGDGCETAQ